MSQKAEIYRIAMALAKGTPVEREHLTPAELRDVFHVLVEAVGPNASFAELAVIDGREAIVRFPRLSTQFISVRASRRLKIADFAFLPDRGSQVWGADPQSFAALLLDDLARYWPVVLLTSAVSIAALVAGTASEFIPLIAQLLAVASTLFFAVFVAFGIREVVRPETAHRLFESGALQEGVDADRYCVRLSVGAFVLAISAVSWNAIAPGILPSDLADLEPLIDLVGLVLVNLAAIAVLLAMLATVDYLLKRSADLVLKQAALQAFDASKRIDLGPHAGAPEEGEAPIPRDPSSRDQSP